MDERFPAPAVLEAERPSPRPGAVRVAGRGETWEQYRARYDRAARRLAEATVAGPDDSWWEAP